MHTCIGSCADLCLSLFVTLACLLPLLFLSPQYYDGETTFVKVHASFETLAKGAEELLIRMPISVRQLITPINARYDAL